MPEVITATIKVDRKDCPGMVAAEFAAVLNELGVKVTKTYGNEETIEYLIEVPVLDS
jgi:hypothetical protein